MGPVIDAKSKEFITGLIDDAEAKGAEVVLDGRPPGYPRTREGPLPRPDHRGQRLPGVLALHRGGLRAGARDRPRRTYEEAIKQVNSSPFGNGAAIFTNDGGVARRFELDVEAGMVGIERADPDAGGLLLLRRLEGVAPG